MTTPTSLVCLIIISWITTLLYSKASDIQDDHPVVASMFKGQYLISRITTLMLMMCSKTSCFILRMTTDVVGVFSGQLFCIHYGYHPDGGVEKLVMYPVRVATLFLLVFKSS